MEVSRLAAETEEMALQIAEASALAIGTAVILIVDLTGKKKDGEEGDGEAEQAAVRFVPAPGRLGLTF